MTLFLRIADPQTFEVVEAHQKIDFQCHKIYSCQLYVNGNCQGCPRFVTSVNEFLMYKMYYIVTYF